MPETCDELALYLHLARASELRRRPLVRDKLLVLAAKTAVEMRLEPVAEHCRAKVLAHNPGHILRNFDSVSAALGDESYRAFIKRLSQAYPRERAEHMLRSLGIVMAGERQVYADDLEYAAALLGTTPERLSDPIPTPPIPPRLPTDRRGPTLPKIRANAVTSHPDRRKPSRVMIIVGLTLTLLVIAVVALLIGARS